MPASSVASPSRGGLVDDVVAAVDVKGLAGDQARWSCARNAVAMPTSSMLTRLRAGAFAFALSSSSSNSGIPDAACVASGPGDRVHADALRAELSRYIADRALKRCLGHAHDVVVLHHHLAAVIGHREERAALAHQRLSEMRHASNVQQDTSIVVRKPSRGTSTTRPCSASFGEKATEWTTKSILPQSLVMRSNTASIWPGMRTSSGIRIGASSSRASGSTNFLGLVVEVSGCQFRSERAERLGAAPGNRLLIGDADDQPLFRFEELGFYDGDHAEVFVLLVLLSDRKRRDEKLRIPLAA